RAHVHDHHAFVRTLEGGIDAPHDVDGVVVVGPDEDAVGAHEVFDGRAFFQELGVGHDAEGKVAAALGQHAGHGLADLVGGAHGHGRLVDHDPGGRHV